MKNTNNFLALDANLKKYEAILVENKLLAALKLIVDPQNLKATHMGRMTTSPYVVPCEEDAHASPLKKAPVAPGVAPLGIGIGASVGGAASASSSYSTFRTFYPVQPAAGGNPPSVAQAKTAIEGADFTQPNARATLKSQGVDVGTCRVLSNGTIQATEVASTPQGLQVQCYNMAHKFFENLINKEPPVFLDEKTNFINVPTENPQQAKAMRAAILHFLTPEIQR